MTLAATGHEEYHEPFKAVIPDGFINVPYNDIDAIKDTTSELGKEPWYSVEIIEGYSVIRKYFDAKSDLFISDF